MFRFLVPRITRSELLRLTTLSVVGAIIAGAYGVAHDQVTYTIAPEYFTKFKFEQFDFVRLENERLFVTVVGFLATWWIGFLMTWFLARRQFPCQQFKTACRSVFIAVLIVLACTVAAGFAGFLYGEWLEPESEVWDIYARKYDIADVASFCVAACIHNASYVGGLFGFILAWIFVRPVNRVNE